MAKILRRFLRDYATIREQYRQGYGRLTTRGYWEDRLDLTDTPAVATLEAPQPEPAAAR